MKTTPSQYQESLDLNFGFGYNTGLWEHVRSNFAASEWDRVATNTAVYLENYFRHKMLDPLDDKKRPLSAGNLFEATFSDEYFPLGSSSGGHRSWRAITSGFVAALSNTDRHRIQVRDDIKQYALGVLGVGSLIITQFEHDYPNSANKRPPIGFIASDGDTLWPPHSMKEKAQHEAWRDKISHRQRLLDAANGDVEKARLSPEW